MPETIETKNVETKPDARQKEKLEKKIDREYTVIEDVENTPLIDQVHGLGYELEQIGGRQRWENYMEENVGSWDEVEQNPVIAQKHIDALITELDKFSPPYFHFGKDKDTKRMGFKFDREAYKKAKDSGEVLVVPEDKWPQSEARGNAKYIATEEEGPEYPVLFTRDGEMMWCMIWW